MVQHYSFCPLSVTIYQPKWSLITWLCTARLLDCVLRSCKIGCSVIHHTRCATIISVFEHWKVPTGTLQHIDCGGSAVWHMHDLYF
jgi:hypothetical protein